MFEKEMIDFLKHYDQLSEIVSRLVFNDEIKQRIILEQENVLIQRMLTTDLIREHGKALKQEHNRNLEELLFKNKFKSKKEEEAKIIYIDKAQNLLDQK